MTRRYSHLKPCTLVFSSILVLALFTLPVVHAQTHGGIRGRVVDSDTGEAIEGALVTVTGQPWGSYTDREGEYRIFNLAPGTYDKKVTFLGYRETTVKGVLVRSGQVYVQNMELTASPIELEGTVIEASRVPILQADVTETRQTVSDQKIKELPIDNIEDIIELQSGVINGTIRGGRIGQEIYVIDGVTVKNFLEGSLEGLGVDLGVLSIQEFSLVSSGFSVEYGQTLSGVINLVTKEGGGQHEGAFRVTSDAIMPEESEYGYSRLEVSAGGPLDEAKRLRYFLSVDGIGLMDAEPVYTPLVLTDGRVLNRLPHNEGDNLNLFGKVSYRLMKDFKLSWSLLSSREQRRFYDPRYKFNLENTLSQHSKGNLSTSINGIRQTSQSKPNFRVAGATVFPPRRRPFSNPPMSL